MAFPPAFVFWNDGPSAALPTDAPLASLVAAFPVGKAFFWTYGTLGAVEAAPDGRPPFFHLHV